ncbi:MAG TPA: SIMPL domain-containing protein [Gemmatimonadaceae bacterium]|nr:SIMPL domain-containing protein [Gemmatimonadaceae bacterium]
MIRTMVLPLALCMAAASASAQLPTQTAAPPQAPPQIVTTGQGEARVTPDRATIFIGVETRAATAAQASADNARRQRAVLDTLRALGIPAAQISTTGFNVYPERVYNPERGDREPRITGYVVHNTVRVEVRSIDQVGRVIDASLAKGANTISSLEFSASNADDARRSALENAIRKARGDAEAMARAAGGQLGELLEVTSIPGSEPPRPFMATRMEAAQADTPINPGEQAVNVTIMARWRFVSGAR